MENKPAPAEDSGQRSTSSAAGLNRDVHRRAFHLHKCRRAFLFENFILVRGNVCARHFIPEHCEKTGISHFY